MPVFKNCWLISYVRAGEKEIRAWTIKPARTESIKHTFMSVLDTGQPDFKALGSGFQKRPEAETPR